VAKHEESLQLNSLLFLFSLCMHMHEIKGKDVHKRIFNGKNMAGNQIKFWPETHWFIL